MARRSLSKSNVRERVSFMNDNKYYELFQQLNIEVEPVTNQYNPETFGKKLMASFQHSCGVSYSFNTDYVPNKITTMYADETE